MIEKAKAERIARGMRIVPERFRQALLLLFPDSGQKNMQVPT
jgi:hypothetical protein